MTCNISLVGISQPLPHIEETPVLLLAKYQSTTGTSCSQSKAFPLRVVQRFFQMNGRQNIADAFLRGAQSITRDCIVKQSHDFLGAFPEAGGFGLSLHYFKPLREPVLDGTLHTVPMSMDEYRLFSLAKLIKLQFQR